MIIQRLESESNANNSDAGRKSRMEIEKLKSELAEETKELRDQHSMALDKVSPDINSTANNFLNIASSIANDHYHNGRK